MNEQHADLVATARKAGVWYLALAVSGVLGFLLLHAQIYVSDDLPKTLLNLKEQESLARMRLLAEFAIIVSQALAAVYFFKLFKDINHFAAWALAAWGMMNAGIIMISAIAMGGSINVASLSLPDNEKLIMLQVFMLLIKGSWAIGSLFFGLWLIPMGYAVVSSKRMPIGLGRVLQIGGVGYIASAFLVYGGLSGSWIDMLTIPATVGEFWMIGYLLIFGIRPQSN
ncbi:DUF4386 domain-containing protein [Chryseotalea sanaruensis]|uniref:DUF4386 domain-containing protein n=1 Tax=Chryseotalea sanaruensis TaxID=2482724 RepID=A0A401U7F3_9BACT|nr:DUF4386 domain-containing protein [Chryseotalea sanaruensis]GCC50824.1 DUF4386 domain-containing protein [Chryseotalea sanaruensis]